ncbi:MAG TPA: transglutaminase-like domain-containing protein [Methylomirabilota bacterium]|jgi:regulator of sirC expression with transglutaminase-like and TPR domain|nr:transglutaminase-like domain-containing protein [Methylomirabilota bacterium]
MPLSARERFAQLVNSPNDDFDLAEASLLIAQEEQPTLDVQAYLQRLDALAEAVRTRLPETPDANAIITQLNTFLFQEEKLTGNAGDYYDPRNSFLNEVLDRKTGIPITLSVIYMEVGRRLGLSLVGVGFPGHFLVKCTGADGDTVLDPFHGGAVLTQEQLELRLRKMYGDGNPFLAQLPQLLAPVSKRDILVRMLRNLKGIYLQRNDFSRALQAIDRIVLVNATLAEEFRDRGAVHQRLGHVQAATQDFKRYLQMAPQAQDAAAIRGMLVRMTAQLN